ncbi:MAG: ComF family protein [candidate division WOR-3 bacterium]
MNLLFRFLNDLEKFVFPSFCPICDNELKKTEIICSRCLNKTFFVSREKCKICGKPLKSGKICKKCKERIPCFDFVISCGSYVPPFSDIIKIYKYRNRPTLSKQLARKLYANYLSHGDAQDIKYSTWVPMTKAEKRERGYNQSRLLSFYFSKISSLTSIGLLRKTSSIPSQTTLPYEKRFTNVKNAYHIRKNKLKEFQGNPEKGIILIDDVLTTGSTLNECAAKLKKAGFKRVIGLVLAISP